MTTTTYSPMLAHLARCATARAHLAAHEGDRARYWRELAAANRLAGFADPSVLVMFDALGGDA